MTVAKVIDIGAARDRTESLDDVEVDEALGYRVHPIAAAFPIMTGPEFDQLVKDISVNGLVECIEYIEHNGHKVIVDGRNRLLACIAAKVQPRFWKLSATAGADLFGYIWSKNVHRRHLDASQRAQFVVEQEAVIAEIAENNAKRRKATQGRPKKGTKKTEAASGSSLSTVEALAKTAKVGKTTIKDAVAVKKSGNAKLIQEVKAGTKSVKAAAKEVRTKKRHTAATTDAKKDAASETGPPPGVPDHHPYIDKKGVIQPPRKAPRKETPRQAAKDLMEIHGPEWCLDLARVIADLVARDGE